MGGVWLVVGGVIKELQSCTFHPSSFQGNKGCSKIKLSDFLAF